MSVHQVLSWQNKPSFDECPRST